MDQVKNKTINPSTKSYGTQLTARLTAPLRVSHVENIEIGPPNVALRQHGGVAPNCSLAGPTDNGPRLNNLIETTQTQTDNSATYSPVQHPHSGLSSLDPHDLSTRASRRAARRAGRPTGHSIRQVNRLNHPDRSGRTSNCARCALATDLTLSGRPAVAGKGYTTERDKVSAWFGYPHGQGWFFVMNRMHIENQLSTWGPGSEAIIFARRPDDRSGHYFNVINQKNRIRFIDGQTGKEAVFRKDYVDYQLLRTDQLLERCRR